MAGLRSAFLFEPNPPHKLTGLLVEDSDAPAAAQADDLPATLTETQLVDAVDKHLARAAAADEFSGAVIIAKKDSVLFQKACGLASMDRTCEELRSSARQPLRVKATT